ncbi:hypothetical protein TNCV_2208211 [Trichonephila clavipes]|uniref:Uncharacterized protein n=1 Tax=Trichonephila clavipes TaxID=2585209 RepID=A0A8X6SBD3_TRICX|nr:hypothetical protein TNCV_2208211 [Trichonephila clavipes]
MCVHHDAAKHGCDHLDAVNRTWIHLRKRCLAISGSLVPPRFVVDYTIKDAPVCDASSKVAVAMVSELRVNTVVNVVELFVQTFVVLQMTLIPILDSVLVTWLQDPLRPCR